MKGYYVPDSKLSLKYIIPLFQITFQMWKLYLIRYNFKAKLISY